MKKFRKGFTLVELLIVIAILGTLAAAMSVSSSSATAAAKAATIYNNINAIKTAAVLYQLQEGNSFKESDVTQAKLQEADILDLDIYNKKGSTNNAIQYTITAGAEVEENASAGAGAYVVCDFSADNDYEAIAKALESYPNIRLNATEDASATKVGALLFHNTPAEYEEGKPSYNADFFSDD